MEHLVLDRTLFVLLQDADDLRGDAPLGALSRLEPAIDGVKAKNHQHREEGGPYDVRELNVDAPGGGARGARGARGRGDVTRGGLRCIARGGEVLGRGVSASAGRRVDGARASFWPNAEKSPRWWGRAYLPRRLCVLCARARTGNPRRVEPSLLVLPRPASGVERVRVHPPPRSVPSLGNTRDMPSDDVSAPIPRFVPRVRRSPRCARARTAPRGR